MNRRNDLSSDESTSSEEIVMPMPARPGAPTFGTSAPANKYTFPEVNKRSNDSVGWENADRTISVTAGQDTQIVTTRKPVFITRPMNRFTFLALFFLITSSTLLVVSLIGHGWATSTKLPVAWLPALNVTSGTDLIEHFKDDYYITGEFGMNLTSARLYTSIGLFESCSCIRMESLNCSSMIGLLLTVRYTSVLAIMIAVCMMAALVFDFTQWSYFPRIQVFHMLCAATLALTELVSIGVYLRFHTTKLCNFTFSHIGELGYAFFLRCLEIGLTLLLVIWWALHVRRIIMRTAKTHQYVTLFSCILLASVSCSTVFRGWMVNEEFQFGLWTFCKCRRINSMCLDHERYFLAAVVFACVTTVLSGVNVILLLHIGWKPRPFVHTVLAWLHTVFVFGEFSIIWRWIGRRLCTLASFESAGGYFDWTFVCCVIAFGLSVLYSVLIALRHAGIQIKGLEDDVMERELKDLV